MTQRMGPMEEGIALPGVIQFIRYVPLMQADGAAVFGVILSG